MPINYYFAYYFYRHVVERHVNENHTEKRPYVKNVRDLDSSENAVQAIVAVATTQAAVEEPACVDENIWRCNVCEFNSKNKAEMMTHAEQVHSEKSQFKCSNCTYRTNGRANFDQHLRYKHPGEPEVTFVLIYQKDPNVSKSKAKPGDSSEHRNTVLQ